MTVVNYNPGPYQDDGAHYTSAEHEEAERIRLAAIQAYKASAEGIAEALAAREAADRADYALTS